MRPIAAALAFVCLGAVSAAQSPQKQPDAQTPKAPTAGQQKPTEPSAPVVESQDAAVKPQDRADKPAPQKQADPSQEVVIWSAAVQAFAAVIVMAFTGALVLYSHRGWKVAKQAADAAAAGALAAQQSADVARDALHLAERAYLTTTFDRIDLVPGANVVTLHIINNGRTPAKDVTPLTVCEVRDVLGLPGIPDYTGGVAIRPGDINPGANVVTKMGVLIPPEELDAIKAFRRVLFAWGRVDYFDVFGNRHACRFGVEYNLRDKNFPVVAINGYNSAD